MAEQVLLLRFWSKVKKEEGDDGCWPWLGGTNKAGYGIITVDGKCTLAHRLSWTMENGPIPDGKDVLHSCDNPPCVRPKHLWLGTDVENNADMMAKGRHVVQTGERSCFAFLSRDQAIDLRRRYAAGESIPSLCAAFGLTHSGVWRIGTGRTWREINDVVAPVTWPVGRRKGRGWSEAEREINMAARSGEGSRRCA